MEKRKLPKIFITDSYKVEHNQLSDPKDLPKLFIFDNFGERGTIAIETLRISEMLTKQVNIHSSLPTYYPHLIGVHDINEGLPLNSLNFFSEIIGKKLDLSNIIVSLQSNNQKD